MDRKSKPRMLPSPIGEICVSLIVKLPAGRLFYIVVPVRVLGDPPGERINSSRSNGRLEILCDSKPFEARRS